MSLLKVYPDLAQLLQISRAHAWALVREHKIPFVRIGRCVRIRPEGVQRYLTAQTTPVTLPDFKSAAANDMQDQ